MKLVTTSALLAALTLLPALARAQEEEGTYGAEEVTPDGAAPAYAPPAPPAEPQPAPQAQPQQAAPPGQWVYTAQYGWIWMPYADAYTSVPASGSGEPYAYVYYPAYATWTWVAAPWIWGFGPWPVFGVWGPARFGWYGHGWWRSPARWNYAPAHTWYPGGGWRAPYRGGAVWSAPRVAPGRGGFVGGGHGFVGAGRGGFAGGGHGFVGGGGHGAPSGGGGHGGGGGGGRGGGRGGGGGHHR
jgi:hypothetical protein